MPSKNIRPFKQGISNEDVLNAIRLSASPDYQNRIPEATKANIQDVLQNLTEYRPQWNEFVEALVNRIGLIIVKNNIWSNPYSKFKRGMMAFGDTVEEVMVGLIKAKTFNPNREALERDIFGNFPVEVQSSFHRINRQDQYEITINQALLQRAFLEEGGLGAFITAQLSAPNTSDQWDEFLIMCSLFREYYDAGGFFKVQVPDLTRVKDATAAEAREFIKQVRAMAGTLQFMSTHYNAAHMPVAANPDELELFITPEALAVTDVDALAGAFNIEKSEMAGRTNLIPKENFNIPGVQAVLTTRDFWVVMDTLIQTTSIFNPATLSTNTWLHHHGIYSASRFVPAILFTTEEGDVISDNYTPVTSVSAVTVEDEDGTTVTELERGEIYQVIASAITTPEGGDNNGVRLEISEKSSSRTRVNQMGTLRISLDEAATSLKITATALDDADFTNSVTLNIVGDRAVMWPNGRVEEDGDGDGLFETAVPPAPTFVDNGATGVVTIPDYSLATDHYKYRKAGVDVPPGETSISASTVFTVVPDTGWELPAGATASWTFAP